MAVFVNPKRFLFVTGMNVFIADIIRHFSTVDDKLDRVAGKYARKIEGQAKYLAPQPGKNPYATGALRDQIYSFRAEKGVWIVASPAPHSVFIEYGVPARNIPPQPYMRPALDKYSEAFVRACTKIAGPIATPGAGEELL